MRYILLLCLCGWAYDRVQAQQSVAPIDWHPSLALVQQELRDQIQAAKAQQTLNRLTGRLAEVADAELFLVYVQLYERSSLAQRTALQREQRRWLKASAIHEADSVRPDGGSVAVAEENDDAIHFTEQRIKELRERLSRLNQHHY